MLAKRAGRKQKQREFFLAGTLTFFVSYLLILNLWFTVQQIYILTSNSSLAVYCLEQRYSPAGYGILVEKLQQGPCTGSRNSLFSSTDQQPYVLALLFSFCTKEHDWLTRSQVPLPTTAVLIGMALVWAWVSDGPCRGARWPFIYIGAVTTVSLFNPSLLK